MNTSITSRVADYLVDCLAAAGVDHVFGVGGANIEDLYDAAFLRPEVTAVLAKHEFSAATMADGYSRSGAGLGVVAATSGGGCLNLVPGLGESLASRVPVLALVGQPPTALDGAGAFQDTSGQNSSLDAHRLFGAVSTFCERVVEPAQIRTALPRAIAAARGGGPAVLLLPKDIQQAALSIGTDVPPRCGELSAPSRVRRQPDASRRAKPSRRLRDDPRPIMEILRRATGPVTIIAGDQVARDDARVELERLRELLGARIACVPDAKDVAGTPSFGSSSALGISGVMGHPGVVGAVASSAVCLLIGTRLPLIARTGLDEPLAAVPTVSIGSVPPHPRSTHAHSDDLRGSLTLLNEALAVNGGPRRGRGHVPAARTELQPPVRPGPGVRYRDAMRVLDEALPDGVDIVVDAGNTGAAAMHYLPVRRDGRFIMALGMGGMGYSFGAGVGVAFGRRRRTVVIAGDGAFYMHGMEVHTALQYRLPITFVLFDNHAHAMCVTREQLFYGDRYSYNRFGPSRLGAGLAAMMPDLSAVDVAEISALPTALRGALNVDGPSVVSIECSTDEIPPFAPFLAKVHENNREGSRQ